MGEDSASSERKGIQGRKGEEILAMKKRPGRTWIGVVSLVAAILGVVLIFSPPSWGFDSKWHAEATRKGMQANGFSSDARLLAPFTNYLTDFFSVVGFEKIYEHLKKAPPPGCPTGVYGIDMGDMARLHFDALTSTDQVEHQWKTLEANTKFALRKWAGDSSMPPKFRPVVLMTIVGMSLHAVQDFYSHSNWVNLFKEGRAGALNGGNEIPIWYEVPPDKRAKMKLISGWYPDGTDRDKVYHEALNKDCSSRPLNPEAVEVASRASVAWVRMLLGEPGIPWDSLKSWKPTPEHIAGPWLRNADATFLTTTSTLAKHWDEPTPSRNVFNPDPVRNRNQAMAALFLSLNVYSENLKIGPGLIPTPNWVGVMHYHVERDLARGLYLQNVKR